VDATKNPAYLRDIAADVDKFRNEFVNFLELCVFTPMTLAGLVAAGHCQRGRIRRGVRRS